MRMVSGNVIWKEAWRADDAGATLVIGQRLGFWQGVHSEGVKAASLSSIVPRQSVNIVTLVGGERWMMEGVMKHQDGKTMIVVESDVNVFVEFSPSFACRLLDLLQSATDSYPAVGIYNFVDMLLEGVQEMKRKTTYLAKDVPRFGELPQELRDKIWDVALPNQGQIINLTLRLSYTTMYQIGSSCKEAYAALSRRKGNYRTFKESDKPEWANGMMRSWNAIPEHAP
ncbi:hypothetical protein BJ878DRAFT_482163 [Calycina marina]|uniref:2EXR domain-containing protein n=1 Tax=Calycina marina TaxID=1763456 RepID=A0A9P7YYX2_9HELO|nr:hypothetical protein BJ878DRAFT_482163 [Calycina marina]